jgi:hypothetical protein
MLCRDPARVGAIDFFQVIQDYVEKDAEVRMFKQCRACNLTYPFAEGHIPVRYELG